MANPFDVLGVSRDAYIEEIQQRYEILRSLWDPSKQSDPNLRRVAEQELEKIEAAYQALIEPRQRASHQYAQDAMGETLTKPVHKPIPPAPRTETPASPVQPAPARQGQIGNQRNPDVMQRNWWLFALAAVIFIVMFATTYISLVTVTADRNDRIRRINYYVGEVDRLYYENEDNKAKVEELNSENQTLRDEVTDIEDQNYFLYSVLYCPEDVWIPTYSIKQNLIDWVNKTYDATDSWAEEDIVNSDGKQAMARYRISYGGNYVIDFYYFEDDYVYDNSLPSNLFWSDRGCWVDTLFW